MNSQEKALARTMFKAKVHSSDGQAYEDLFVAIMQKANPNFVPIKPQGSHGDRKNDGYDPTEGHYYQVYAPESLSKSAGDAVAKANEDFSGLIAHWEVVHPIHHYSFVMNDKYKGSFPTIESDLAEIAKNNKIDSAQVFLSKDLEDLLFKLPDDVIFSIIGYLPDPEKIERIDYGILGEVIGHLMENKLAVTEGLILDAPDFSEKIEFNGLSAGVANLLNTASYQVGAIDEFFELNSTFAKQALRDHLAGLYRAEKDAADEPFSPDQIFFQILYQMVPNEIAQARDAALVLMAYFFEACDIFEDPAGAH